MTLDIQTISTIATSPAVWAICCILLVGFILKKIYEKNDSQEERLITIQDEYRSESKEREGKLMNHLKRSDEAQERTATAVEGIHQSLNKLEGRVDRIEQGGMRG